MAKCILAIVVVYISLVQPVTADVLRLDTEFEYQATSCWENRFPYADGAFLAFERSRSGRCQDSEPHRVVAVDALTGEQRPSTEPLEREYPLLYKHGESILAVRRFVAADGHHHASEVAILAPGTAPHVEPVQLEGMVADAVWAGLDRHVQVAGDTLSLLVQDNSVQHIARYRLPELTDLGKTQIERGLPIAFVNGQILGVFPHDKTRRALKVISLDGEVREQTVLDNVPSAFQGRYCQGAIASTQGRFAVMMRNCGRYEVVDASSGRTGFAIPVHDGATFFQTAINDRYVFVRPLVEGHSNEERPSLVFVYDLATGRELARQLLPRGELVAVGDKLVVKHLRGSLSVHVYSIDDRSLRDSEWSSVELERAAENAKRAADPYLALDKLEEATLAPLLADIEENGGKRFPEVAALYGRLLAVNPRQAKKGAAILRKLVEAQTQSARAIVTAAAQRASVFSTDDEARETALAAIWRRADERPLQASRIGHPAVEFDPFSNQIHFHGQRAFVAQGGSVGVGVHDRRDWTLLQSVGITASDSEKQEYVAATAFVSGRMFVSLANRFPEPSDVNLYVYDLETLDLLKSLHTKENGAQFVSGENVLGICNCEIGDPRACRAIDPVTLAPVSQTFRSDAVCVDGHRQAATVSPTIADLASQVKGRIVAIGDGYFVTDHGHHPLSEYEFHPWRDVTASFRFQRPVTSLRELYFTVSGEGVVIADRWPDKVRYYFFEFSGKTYKTVIELPNEWSNGASDGKSLFLASGSYVLALDLRSGAILDWAEVFERDRRSSARAPRDDGIVRLLVDGDRLVAVGKDGKAAVFDLGRFYEATAASVSPYSETSRILLQGLFSE